jgi:hypothetical protein
MDAHPGTPIIIYEVDEICGKGYPLAFNSLNIQAGFTATVSGQVHEFLSSAVADRPDTTQFTVEEILLLKIMTV